MSKIVKSAYNDQRDKDEEIQWDVGEDGFIHDFREPYIPPPPKLSFWEREIPEPIAFGIIALTILGILLMKPYILNG